MHFGHHIRTAADRRYGAGVLKSEILIRHEKTRVVSYVFVNVRRPDSGMVSVVPEDIGRHIVSNRSEQSMFAVRAPHVKNSIMFN